MSAVSRPGEIDRLGQEHIDARCAGFLLGVPKASAETAMSRLGATPGRALQAANFPRQGQTVESRHPQIEHHDASKRALRHGRARLRQRRFAIGDTA